MPSALLMARKAKVELTLMESISRPIRNQGQNCLYQGVTGWDMSSPDLAEEAGLAFQGDAGVVIGLEAQGDGVAGGVDHGRVGGDRDHGAAHLSGGYLDAVGVQAQLRQARGLQAVAVVLAVQVAHRQDV